MASNSNVSAMGATLNGFLKILQIVAVIALPVIGWAWMHTWERITAIEKDIVALRVGEADLKGDKLTNIEWVQAKNVLDQRDNELDKRLTRTEEISLNLKEQIMLMRDEQKQRFMELSATQKEILSKITDKNLTLDK